jgi:hypothetical protein
MQDWRCLFATFAVIVVVVSGAGCTMGTVGGQPGVPGAAGPTAGRPAEPPPMPAAACAPAAPARAAVLTRAQYVHAAGDLLGLDVEALAAFADVAGRQLTPGVSLTALQVEQRMLSAEAIAAAATAPGQLARLLPCDPAAVGESACADQVIDGLGARAFRRPLDAETRESLRALFDAGHAEGGFAGGVAWLVSGLLQAPDFLYQLAPRPAGAAGGDVVALDPYTLASRLAFFIWNAPPDAELLTAAGRGELDRADGVSDQVARLLAHPHAARTRDEYHAAWLGLGDLPQVARAALELTPALIADLRRSALAGVADVFGAAGGGRIEALFSSPTLFVNDALAKVYGLPSPGGTALQAAAAPDGQRQGILTHPALLTLLASADSSDPIKRGIFVQESVLCQSTPDPIDDIPDLPPLRPGLSTRARLEQHRRDPVCAACHRFFDPLGMAFENYDAIGRFRVTDQGVPVDSSTTLEREGDLDGQYASGAELLARLGGSARVRDCLAQRWFEYAFRRPLEAGDACALDPLQARLRESGDLRALVAAIAASDVFRLQRLAQE